MQASDHYIKWCCVPTNKTKPYILYEMNNWGDSVVFRGKWQNKWDEKI